MNEVLRTLLFLPPQRSTVAQEIDTLHYFVILVTMAGAALVTALGGWLIYRYRRRSTQPGLNPNAHVKPGLAMELLVVVSLLGLFLLWWVLGVRQFVRLRVAPEDSMPVYVTAKQWMWKFAYPEGSRSITTLYVPVRRPVKLIMTSRDVIHSFYVPDFRIKQDVVPGRYTTVWFEVKEPGTYQILCAEYCGTGHSTMRGEVVALEPGDYESWLGGGAKAGEIAGPVYVPPAVAGQGAPNEALDLVRVGQSEAAAQGCLRCHSTDGTPHIGPTWAGMYGSVVRLVGGDQVIADEAYITESMMDPKAKIHAGFEPVMPSYQGRLRPPEVAAILEFMGSLRNVPPGLGRDHPDERFMDGGVPPSRSAAAPEGPPP